MAKGQHWQNERFEFAGCDFHDLSLFIFLALYFQKAVDVSFLLPLESLHFDI
jgi:4-hydroxy-L-threonine phosphate dehydrogenase PdxA